MRRYGLCLACSLQQEELWKDGHALEPDAEGPGDLIGRVFIRVDEREDERAAEQVLHAEGVEIWIVGRLVRVGHKVDGVAGRAEEEQLENGVVGAVEEGPEEIDIARYVHYQV